MSADQVQQHHTPLPPGDSGLHSLKTILYMPYTFKLNVDLEYAPECVMQDRLVCAPCQ